MILGKIVKGIGGAMDLMVGTKHVIVLVKHTAEKKNDAGDLGIPSKCTLPLADVSVVDRVITNLGMINMTE